MTLGEILVRLRADVGPLSAGMNTASGAVKKFGDDAAAASSKAGGAMKGLGSAAAGGAQQATQGLMSISAAGLNMTMRLNPAMLAASLAIAGVGMAAVTMAGILKDALVSGLGASLQEAIKFEAAFAQVRKVIPDVATSVNALREGLLAMSTTIPMTAEGLASIAAIGGQMGIDATPDLLKFTDTVARLSVTAEMSSDTVASALGRIGEVVDPNWKENIDKMGSSLVFVADQSNASAAEIVNMSRRLSGAGAAAGMTAPQIFGIASALASVGVRAEAGGGSMSSFIMKMSQAVSEGGSKLETFARVAQMSSSQFATMFKSDAAGAMVAFTEGLSRLKDNGTDLNVVLKELGITEIRQRQSMLGLAQAGDELRRNIANATQGYEENTALMLKSGMIFDTTAAKIQMFEQGIARMGKRIGDAFLPFGKNILDIFVHAFDQIDAFMREKGPEMAASLAPLGELLTTLTAGIVASGPELIGVLGSLSEWLIGIDITNLKGMVDEFRFLLEGMRMVSPELDKIMKRGEEYRKNLAIQKQYKAADVMLGSQIGRDLGLAPTAAPLLPGTDAGNAGFPFRRGVLPSEAQAMGNFDMGGVPWEGGEEWEAASAATEKFNKELTDTQAELSQIRAEGTGAFAGIEAGIQGALAKEIEHAKTLGLSSTQLATLIGQYKAVAAAKLEAAKITELRSQRGYVAGDAQKEATALSATVGTGLGQAEIRGVTDMVEIGKKLDELRTKALANGDTFSVPANLKESLDYYTDVVKGTEQAIEASNRWQKSLEELGPTIRTIGIDFEKIIAPLDKLGSKAGNDQIANAFNALAEQRDKVDITAPGGEQMYADITGKMTEYYDVLASRGKSALQLIGVGTEKAKEATMDWKTGLAGVNDLMQALGVSAGSLPGILMSVTGGIGGLLSTLKASADKGGFGGFGGFLSGLMGKGIKGDGKNVFEGMLGSLGFAGQAFAIGTSLFKGLKGLFSEPSWKKVGREAGGVLGTEIGEEMAKKIEEKAKKLGISVKNAALLSLPDVMSSSGKDARTFGMQAMSLLEAVKNGSVPAAEGMKALGDSFNQIKDSAMKAGDVGSNAMVALINGARQAGKMTEEMKSFVREQVDLSIGGVNKAFGATQNIDGKDQFVGLDATTQESASAQATIFATTFWAAVKEKGVIGAADAMKATFDSMKKRMEDSGFDVSKIFGPIEALMNFSQDPKFRGAAEGANGLNEALKGLANSGYMTRDAFSAFGVGANDAFQQALAVTGDQKLALEAIAPLLGSLRQAARNYGVELDGPTQDLIKAAEEQGIVFPEEPLQRIADILEGIAKVLGADIPAAAARAGTAIGNMPAPREGFANYNGPETPGYGSGGSFGSVPPDVSAASGFGPVLLRSDTIIQAHEGELAMIVPRDQSKNMRHKHAARGLFNIRNEGDDGGGGGGLPDPGSLGGGDGGGSSTGSTPDAGGGSTGAVPAVVEQQSQQIAMLTEAIGRLAERDSQQVTVVSRPEIKIDENPLRSREAAAELRRITVDEVEKAIRLGQGTLIETIKQALNL